MATDPFTSTSLRSAALRSLARIFDPETCRALILDEALGDPHLLLEVLPIVYAADRDLGRHVTDESAHEPKVRAVLPWDQMS